MAQPQQVQPNLQTVQRLEVNEGKRKLYAAILSLPIDELSDSDIEIMTALGSDPDIQEILESHNQD